ncbi:MAG: SGNH/GDSL hydrolase family protein [Planctomycetota bacterium]|jgi:hypothetical protein
MHPFIGLLISGSGFLVASTILALGYAATWHRHSGCRRGGWCAIMIAAMVMAVGGEPVPLWLLAASAGALIMSIGRGRHQRLCRALTMMLLLALSGLRLAREQAPTLTVHGDGVIYVLGDSISAGTFAGETLWPTRVQQHTNITTVNLAQPGAVVADGIAMLDHVPADAGLILVELGGNDLLGDAGGDFASHLDTLCRALIGHNAVMFELPLGPLGHHHGATQLRLGSPSASSPAPSPLIMAPLTGSTSAMPATSTWPPRSPASFVNNRPCSMLRFGESYLISLSNPHAPTKPFTG